MTKKMYTPNEDLREKTSDLTKDEREYDVFSEILKEKKYLITGEREYYVFPEILTWPLEE